MIFRWLHRKFLEPKHSNRADTSSSKPRVLAAPVPSGSTSSTTSTTSKSSSSSSSSSSCCACGDAPEQELSNPGNPRAGEQLTQGRLIMSGKVFPTQRRGMVAAQAQRRSQLAVPSPAAADTANCTNSIKLRRVKCLFSVIRSPLKWTWPQCHSHKRSSSRPRIKCVSFQKVTQCFGALRCFHTYLPQMLARLQKRACFSSCRTSTGTSNHKLPVSAQVPNPAQAPNRFLSPSHPTAASESVQVSPQKRSFRKSLSASDPEYWINSNSDYVDFVMTSDMKDSRK
ncbi:uncharacterized protein LOC112340542 isoform X2 [Selaginella moellendorffii]|uniref:uncharacterized protein LOC112340542 isoform X2 n=1 Tax=Selaginella moellendorffii TaxID=88036 RepID=UPI000D1CBBE5|nr:uncharacterized protein LOC112340542 isoform X2 [Selaginella moellendorffii]|eukprot:XP_024514905.1 uncharacterized protein LOC112340542 isoform X2 [Selaginella moellendorffii]